MSEMSREPNSPEEILRNQSYIALTTFKKSGQGSLHPHFLFLIEVEFFSIHLTRFWKVRRIRNNPNVEVAPAKARMGAPKDYKIIGKTIKGVARLLEGEEAKVANRLLRKKYGVRYTLINILQGTISRKGSLLFYEVTPKT